MTNGNERRQPMTGIEPMAVAVAALIAKQAAESLGSETGKSTWTAVTRLATLVRRKLSSSPSGTIALNRLDAAPQDQAAIEALAEAVREHSREDIAFHEELVRFLAELTNHPVVGYFVTQVSGEAHVGKLVQIDVVHGDVSL
jgi:MoxR-like ATPase